MGDYKPDRPIFCGNFEYDAHERDIERLFKKYGDVDRMDMKTGFAFVYMRDKRDGEDAIRKLDGMTYGYKRRRLRVEWANHVEETKRREVKPNTTLFIVNFDVRLVRERDLERHFSRYGKLVRTEIKKNYAFVQFSDLEDAIDAQKRTHDKDFMGRNITVEFVANEDPHAKRDDRYRSPGRSRSRSPIRNRSRSPPYSRKRSRSPTPRRRSISPRRSVSPRRSPSRSRSRSPVRSASRSPRRSFSGSPRR